MKPSPAFDMLTRETVFQEVGRVMGGLGLQARSPSLPSSLPIIFCLFAISPLACFFSLFCTELIARYRLKDFRSLCQFKYRQNDQKPLFLLKITFFFLKYSANLCCSWAFNACKLDLSSKACCKWVNSITSLTLTNLYKPLILFSCFFAVKPLHFGPVKIKITKINYVQSGNRIQQICTMYNRFYNRQKRSFWLRFSTKTIII